VKAITLGTYGSRMGEPDWPRDKQYRIVATRRLGEMIMNRIQKAATAFMALSITLVGAALVTAPLALADLRPAGLHHGMSSIAQTTASKATPRLRHG